MKRHKHIWLLIMVATILTSLSLSLSPAAGAAPHHRDGKEQCQGDGFLSVTTADGEPFKNAGQCMKYIRQGGEVVARARLIVTFTAPVDDRFYVDVSGSGLLPGAFLYVGTDVSTPIDVFQVDAAGNLAFTGGYYPCGTFTWFEYSTLDKGGLPIATRTATPC